MLEYEGKLALLAGDALPSVMLTALHLHWPNQKPQVELLKLSHHGSKANTDDSLLKAIDCRRFLFSSNGKGHKHPDTATIARVLKNIRNPQLIFNYDQPQTTNWRTIPEEWPQYTTVYPAPDARFTAVNMATEIP
jgi:beta-lactamase superfamily II metal-dependent hydrolase